MRRVRGLWPAAVIAVIAGVSLWLLLAVWGSSRRDDFATFGAYAVAVAGLAGSLTAWLLRAWARRRRPGLVGMAMLDQAADVLAAGVRDQWMRAAAGRGLLVPEPIPVRWAKPSLALAGPVSAAAASVRFLPLPGVAGVGVHQLQAGDIYDLYALYGGLGSGRLIVAGPPGSGKTGAAVILILEALSRREQLPYDHRRQAPALSAKLS
jgi:hypothetical protein